MLFINIFVKHEKYPSHGVKLTILMISLNVEYQNLLKKVNQIWRMRNYLIKNMYLFVLPKIIIMYNVVYSHFLVLSSILVRSIQSQLFYNEPFDWSYVWLVGLGVWFSLWVREVPGSNPGRALQVFWYFTYHPYNWNYK